MKKKNFGPTLPTTIREVWMFEQTFKNTETSLTVYEKCSFGECNLTRAKFYSCVFSGCWFTGANLANAKFVNCRFENCCFFGVNLYSGNFVECLFDECYFLGANLHSCELNECMFVECSFLGANVAAVFADKHTLFDNCYHLERLSVSPFFEQPEAATLND
jgi:uncharacterized protein YjbI with pentapeptide repeats